jgi:uncharacterized protein (TIGR03437 family)
MLSMRRHIIPRAALWGALAIFLGRVYGSDADALAITASIQNHHLPFTTIVDPIYTTADSTQIKGYTRCGDSAIWTGHYLAAEAFRYNVTHSPDALDDVKKATSAIKSLVDVTAVNLLARCAIPMSSPFAAGIQSEEASNGIFTNNSAAEVWVGNTSRDQYLGVMFGLGVAYDMVDDAGVQSTVRDVVTRLVDFLSGHGWTVVMPNGSVSTSFALRGDQVLGLLQLARHVNPDHFSTAYDIQRVLRVAEVTIPVGLEVLDDGSYFKFNLDYINFYNLIRLESSSAKSIYKSGYDIVRSHTASHRNAFFNMIDRALNGADATRDAETATLLQQWLLRPKRDKSVDLHGTVPVCGDQACQPVPVALRPPTDFLWQRNPFQLTGGGSGLVESAGIDYILPYWMARYYGVVTATSVTSAAANSAAVAPDSIVSIFGANFATATAQAGPLPLPTSLGGVSVKVRDSAGVDRDAALVYVSPTQINLVLPTGVAPGQAQFTIATAAVTQPQLTTGLIQKVAPTLFSMNGNGTGVAAATAIRVQVANPQLRGPVPVFQCNNAGSACVSVPMDVGLDAPVYISFYATGIRNLSSLANVSVTIHGMPVPVQYAGLQSQFPGLDQVNVLLPLGLRGSGESDVVLTVDWQVSNAVTVNIQ